MTTLFEATADLGPETVTAEVIHAAICGYKDPRTMDYWPGDDSSDDVLDHFYPGNAVVGDSMDVTNLGVLTTVATWGGSKDETPIGLVVRYEETGKEYLLTGVYSSWDGTTYEDCVEAEEYTFTEQRWRAKA